MGEVYRGRDPRLNREVAIKVLPSSLSSDPDRLRRFELEARAAGALNHPNIVSVYDVGFHDGTPYVVTELLEGETLRAELAGGKIPPRRAIDYALQISQGLAAAHEKGIVHRDLKPENLFITTHGRLKILDFGLAKLETSAASPGSSTQAPTMAAATEPGVVLGTLGYMSPEQVRGGSADVRSDIFAFGAILLEMLTGSRAFQRESAADTISAILKEEPPIPGDRRGGIPREMDRIIRHCLEKKPEQRFQSAHDLAFALSTAAGEFERSRGPRFGRTSFLTIAAVIAALGLAIVLLRARGGEARRPAGPASERKSIAVLPFQNLSPDPENAFFADGMTEDILTQLAKVGDLKVISRTSVMRYKGTQKPIKEIASELGVGTVLEGSVRRAGDRVRIAGQLVDARSDEHLWAETYDRELKDVFGIQSEVAQKIAAALRATLSSAEKKRIERPPTQNLAAYDLYLKGRDLYYHYRKADNESAIELFQNALGLDSGFALAYAGLGDGYAQRALRFGFPASWLTSSLEMGRKAVALDPELAEGHKAVALAHLVGSRYRESLDSGRRAIALNPNHATAIYNYGAVLRFLGRLDEALPWMKRAIELDPKNPILASGVGITYAALNEPAEAERWFQRSLELQPDLGQSHAYLIWLYMYQRRDREALEHARATVARLSQDPWTVNAAGTAELVVGDPARARELFDRILPIYKGTRGYRDYGPGIETHLAFLDVRAGRVSDANERLEESAATDRRLLESGSQDPSVPFDTACVHALRGQRDEAFRWLGKAVEAGWRDGPFGSRTPLLDSLKSDPRFQKLNSRIESLVKEMRRRAGLGQS